MTLRCRQEETIFFPVINFQKVPPNVRHLSKGDNLTLPRNLHVSLRIFAFNQILRSEEVFREAILLSEMTTVRTERVLFNNQVTILFIFNELEQLANVNIRLDFLSVHSLHFQ